MGLDGKPRELHVAESMASIDFADFEPTMDKPRGDVLAECAHFKTNSRRFHEGGVLANPDAGRFSIVTVIQGRLTSTDGRRFETGASLLLPKAADPLQAAADTTVLQITVPERSGGKS